MPKESASSLPPEEEKTHIPEQKFVNLKGSFWDIFGDY